MVMHTPLVFLHGWGQSAQVWYPQQQTFPHAHFMNLPGHGGEADSTTWMEALAKQLPQQPCTLVGWSLGGMLAMQLAITYPEKVKSLVLVSSTAKFRASPDWVYGCPEHIFNGFEQGIAHQTGKTMSRFFALMFHGEGMPRKDYQHIAHHAVDRHHPPSEQALHYGLTLLSDLDLRDELVSIQQPALIIHGECDAIVQVESADYLAEHMPHATLCRFKHIGHAPFLSSRKQFHSLLEQWCQTY
jgi:pimeloyl-[acyl-carrier protein] methyl ester esterase